MSKYKTISDDKTVQKHYEKCIDNGCSETLAETLALRKPPGFTDTYSPMAHRRGRGKGGAGRVSPK